MTCEHCRELLFDSIYGLLEEGQSQELHAHLKDCPECQAELEIVRSQQKLLSRAARAIASVPEFSLPSVASAAVDVLPAEPREASAPPARRALWQRPWVVWATAAAILLAVSASISTYRHSVATLQDELTAQRREFDKIEQRFAALPAKHDALERIELQDIRDHSTPYLNVTGPRELQADAKANLHVTTRQADGDVAAKLKIKLVEQGTSRVVHQSRIDSAGDALVELDAARAIPGSNLDLIVEAETKGGTVSLRESMQSPAPGYVTRIDISKDAYPIRDLLFFRVLVLDRFSLKPPSQPVVLRVQLLNPKNEIVRQALMPVGEGGVISGEWAIEEKFLAGNYVLQAGPADGTAAPAQLASRRLEVVRDLRVPDIRFDQKRYKPGEQLTGDLPGGLPIPDRAYGNIGNQAVPVTIQQDLRSQAALNNRGTQINPAITNNAIANNFNQNAQFGNSALDNNARQRFQSQVPDKVPAGAKDIPITVTLERGKQKQEYRAVVPLASPEYAIDFFPEGGDLIAGVPNRVFYRVRVKSGEAVTGAGRVSVLSDKNEIVDSTYQFGMGHLDFTPRAKESYTVRITSPAEATELTQPFAKLGIRTSGLVLHVPEAVGKQGEPIRVTLRNQGPSRRLMLVAECRGQIVDQRWIDIKATQLQPVPIPAQLDTVLQTSGARGIIRVTAYALEQDALEPIAERLVFRAESQRLELGVTLNTKEPQAGQQIQAKVNARTEVGAPAAAWVLASVVDESVQTRPNSLSAHFLLLNEVHNGADLDDAQLLLRDSPESVQMLERFLGTHGWRRFAPPRPPANVAQADRAHVARPLIFSRENFSLEPARKEYEEKSALALAQLRQNAVREQAEVADQRQRATGAFHVAAARLDEFKRQVDGWIRLALGAFLTIMLGVSVVLIGVGAYRIVRANKTATPALGGAFACLAVCLTVVLAGRSLTPLDVADHEPRPNSLARAEGDFRLEKRLAQAPPQRNESLPAGSYVLRMPAPTKQDDRMLEAQAKKAYDNMAVDALALREQQVQNFANNRDGGGLAGPARQNRALENKALLDRIKADQQKEPLPSAGAAAVVRENDGLPRTLIAPQAPEKAMSALKKAKTSAPPAAAIPRPAAEALSDSKKESKDKVKDASKDSRDETQARRRDERLREYAHQHVPNLFADTLYWNPSLYLPDGAAEIRFDIASGQAIYRLLLLGHTSAGRFGYHESRLDVPPDDPTRKHDDPQ